MSMPTVVGFKLVPKPVTRPLPGGKMGATQLFLLSDDGKEIPSFEFHGYTKTEADSEARAEGRSRVGTVYLPD